MIVEAQVAINGSRQATWAAIVDIENSAQMIRGIQRIEIIEKPASGLVGLKWRETRMLFEKPATVEKTIVEVAGHEFYVTRAESEGFVFLTTFRISEITGGVSLTATHVSKPRTIVAKLQVIPMSLLFKGTIRKYILQDLDDIKAAVEQPPKRG